MTPAQVLAAVHARWCFQILFDQFCHEGAAVPGVGGMYRGWRYRCRGLAPCRQLLWTMQVPCVSTCGNLSSMGDRPTPGVCFVLSAQCLCIQNHLGPRGISQQPVQPVPRVCPRSMLPRASQRLFVCMRTDKVESGRAKSSPVASPVASSWPARSGRIPAFAPFRST